MSKWIRLMFSMTAFLVSALMATPSQAIPAFARQTGKACATCHFQHYPALNDYGREFKAGGFAEMGKQGTVTGKELSIPEVLNASLFFKIRYQDTNGTDNANEPTAASGEWQFPDEFALLFGGRVSEHAGFMLEAQLADPSASWLAGFKIPFMYDVGSVKLGIVPFTTDALGASYGFELLNTGAVRNVRMMEHRNESSAQQYVGTASAAMGAALVLWHPQFFANLTTWSPEHAAASNGLAQGGHPGSIYARAAWTPSLGSWDFGIGAQMWSGSSDIDDGTGAGTTQEVDTKAQAVDAQLQGTLGSMPLGVYLTWASADATSAGGTPNLFNGNPNDETATTLAAELGVLPGKATIMLAYRIADNGANTFSDDNATTIGGTWQLAQNIQLQLLHSIRDEGAGGAGRYDGSQTGGDALTTFMFSAGF